MNRLRGTVEVAMRLFARGLGSRTYDRLPPEPPLGILRLVWDAVPWVDLQGPDNGRWVGPPPSKGRVSGDPRANRLTSGRGRSRD
jgi:hypothetical protein